MPKQLKEVAMIIKCREIEPSQNGNQFPRAIVEDTSLGLLVGTDISEKCRFSDAVTAMKQTAQSGDIIVCPSGVYHVNDDDDPNALWPGVMAERGFIVRPIHGNTFYYRYLAWYGRGPGLKELRSGIANGTLPVPEYSEEAEAQMCGLENSVEVAEESLATAETNLTIARSTLDGAWMKLAEIGGDKK